MSEYEECFKNRTKKLFDKAEKYTKEIFLSECRNIERICKHQGDADYYQMQHFISDSRWDARGVMDKAALRTSWILPRKGFTELLPLKPNKESIQVDNYQKHLSPDQWTEIKIRTTAKGYLKAKFHLSRVFIWNKARGRIEKRLLVIRKHRTKKGVELKYSFTNASLENMRRRHGGLRKEQNVKTSMQAIEKPVLSKAEPWFDMKPEIFKQKPLYFKNKILSLKNINQVFINNLVKLDIY